MDKDEKTSLRNLRRRVDRVRNFPVNTCPASRHLHTIAESLARGEKYTQIDDEPEHVAESMLMVLEALWKARTKMAKIAPNNEVRGGALAPSQRNEVERT